MKIMKNNTGGNHLIITLNSNDLYDMRFESHRMNRKTYELTIKVKAEETNIPASDLQRVFTELSGLYTRMAEESGVEGDPHDAEYPKSLSCARCNRELNPNRDKHFEYKGEFMHYECVKEVYERNYKHWVDGTYKILRKEVFINPNNNEAVRLYGKDDIEIIVALVKEGNEYKVGKMDKFDDGRFWGKKTFATKKEAIEYFNLSVKRSKCEHESGFKLSDPDSTFYDSHERFHFYCCDCGVSALGDVEPDFRYFGEDNDDSSVFEVESFNAEKFVGDFNKSWEGVHYWQACPNSIIEGGSNENCNELEFVGYDDEARVMCPNCKETWPIESRESFTAYKFGADELEFTDWANQETKHHGKTSLKGWADHEIKKHGANMPFDEWAKHEDKSHIKRYGAEDGNCVVCEKSIPHHSRCELCAKPACLMDSCRKWGKGIYSNYLMCNHCFETPHIKKQMGAEQSFNAENKSLPYKWIAGAIALGLSLPYISSLLNSGREK
jgi:hypothetical protein